jgi:hypothetical protein
LLLNFTEEFLRRHKERVLLENAGKDNHRLRSHDVNYRVPSKFSEMKPLSSVVLEQCALVPNLLHKEPPGRLGGTQEFAICGVKKEVSKFLSRAKS